MAAAELEVGCVETPIFAGAASEPDYLLVRTAAAIAGTFRVVPAALVGGVDPVRRRVVLAADRDTVAGLPERLPVQSAPALGVSGA